MRNLNLKAEYSTSHALVIGINDYGHVAPLRNATDDANNVAEALQKNFSFAAGNLTKILDKEATRANILSAYFAYAKSADADSRLFVFFAGHGFTKSGENHEVGFLVPHDGKVDDLSTLIRWEEFTLNADLIPAKHILFVMDACYGGLVFNRAVSAGSVRFLKDMLLRPVRQALAYWGDERYRSILSKALSRVTDHLETESGLVIWNSLRWYPAILLSYSTGVASVANGKYENLQAVFSARTPNTHRSSPSTELVLTLGDEVLEIERSSAFKQLPGRERQYVPRSEYLLKLLQPELDDDLFLGKEYENVFDRFEVLLALAVATIRSSKESHIWGPVGRFGWKFSRPGAMSNPLAEVITEAQEMKSDWPPFKAGLFGSNFDAFITVAHKYAENMAQLGWWS